MMKNKYLLIKLAGIFFLLFLVVFYFIFYFIPTVEAINRNRREMKDINFKITNFLEMQKEFTFTNPQEKILFAEIDRELNNKIPGINSREEYIALFTRCFDYIKNLARRDGVMNLIINANSNELDLNASTLSSDKAAFERLMSFSRQKLTELKESTANEKKNDDLPTPTPPIPGLPSFLQEAGRQTVFLIFSSDLKSALNFINHIPWTENYLRLDKITVGDGSPNPYFVVILHVFYIDKRLPDEQ